MANSSRVHISKELMDAFRQASLDNNPLHSNAGYAARTHFGAPVVFGVLSALAALSKVPPAPGQTLESVELDFREAVFPGELHEVRLKTRRGGRLVASIHDGPRLLGKATLRFRPGKPPATPASGGGLAPRSASRPGAFPEEGTRVRGVYAPDWEQLHALMRQLGVDNPAIGPAHIAALAFSSYLVGMELPGERALYWRLSLKLAADPPEHVEEFDFQAVLESVDSRFSLATVSFELSAPGAFASGQVQAFERQQLETRWESTLPTEELAGQVALVVGASRGLGAAMAVGLARRGATCVGSYRRDVDGAREVSEAGGSRIEMTQGDGADSAWCAQVVEDIGTAHGKLDLLICNASPPLRPLAVAPQTTSRIQEYIQQAVALVAEPLAASLPALDRAGGTVVLVSTSAIHSPPALWPHYAAAKGAVEGLIRAAAAGWPKVRFIVLRPPRLETGFTFNAGLAQALPPALVMDRLAQVLVAPVEAGEPLFVEEFGAAEP